MTSQLNFAPQVLIGRALPFAEVQAALAQVFGIPIEFVFAEGLPVSYDAAVFERGYFEVFAFSEGEFPLRADGFVAPDVFTDTQFHALSTLLDCVICVDFSESDWQPHFTAYLGGRKYDQIEVIEDVDAADDPIYWCEFVRAAR